ncbi:MAG: DNA/RNA helicase domain-containing protein, partial [Bacteroidales bacterium]
LTDKEYAEGVSLDLLREHPNVVTTDRLHLAVSLRSFRAEKLSLFVQQLLDKDSVAARCTLSELDKYPIVITRSVDLAKRWLKKQARGNERYGMIVSSQAYRLRPLAIDVRFKPDPVHWFLADRSDIRSSYYLEDVVTEFDIQGLELDYTCVVWDGDFRCEGDHWGTYSFRGNKWVRINKEERKMYLKNAYRVLLTRARQGMVIVVPEGDVEDITRKPEYYDASYAYLRDLGIKELHNEDV